MSTESDDYTESEEETEGPIKLALISREALPRIKSAERQIHALLVDLVHHQKIDVRWLSH